MRSLGQSFFLETSRNNVLFFVFKAYKLLGKLLWIQRLQMFLDEKCMVQTPYKPAYQSQVLGVPSTSGSFQVDFVDHYVGTGSLVWRDR